MAFVGQCDAECLGRDRCGGYIVCEQIAAGASVQPIPAGVNAVVLYDSVDGDLTALCKCLLDCRRSVIGTVNVEACLLYTSDAADD